VGVIVGEGITVGISTVGDAIAIAVGVKIEVGLATCGVDNSTWVQAVRKTIIANRYTERIFPIIKLILIHLIY